MGAMPKVVDHAVRRAELVDAAWRVIAGEGLEAATMRRIAEAAGCTTGRVTHYFDSKDDVLVAALREVHKRAGERMIRHIGGADVATVLLEVLLEALPVDEDRQLEWKVWLAFWGRAAADERLRREQEQRYAEWRSLLDKLVRRARPRDTAADRCTAVDLVAGAIDGLGIQAVLEPASFTNARLRRAASAIVGSVVAEGK
jgi:TetR/AcrR family transcriptional regulator, transcriptional repressor of bet genes